GTNPIGTPPATIPAGESRTLNVSFTPQGAGAQSATLTITSNDPDSPSVTFSFQGIGVAQVPNIQVTPSPATHDFGSINTGGSSAAFTVTIENTGNADLSVSAISLTNTQNFTLNTQPGTNPIGTPPATIPAGESRTLNVSFTPQDAGAQSAALTISSNDPDSPSVTFSFQGTVLPIVENWATFGPDYCLGLDACLSSPIITALLLDNNGTLWIGTWPYTVESQTTGGGICAYNLYTGAFACFDENDGLVGNMVIDIAMSPQGDIWVAAGGTSGDGVSLYIGEGMFETFGPDDMGMSDQALINDITVDANGHPWVATSSGIFEYDGTDWVNYSTSGENIFEGEPFSLNDDVITGILAGPSGRLFIGTWTQGLFIKDPGGNSSHFGSTTSGTSISNMAIDPNGTLWFAAVKGGENTLMSLAPGGSPVTVPVPSELATSSSAIKALFIDPATGDIFIGSDLGFYRYDRQTWSTFDTSNSGLVTNQVNALLIDSFGDYWIGTEEGLSHLNFAAPSFAGGMVYGEGEKKTDLPISTTISVRFGEPMRRTSAESSFEMIDHSNGAILPGTFTWNESFTIMTFKPATTLKYGATYMINIYYTAEDRWGRTIDLGIGPGADFRSFTIKTKAAPKPPSSTTPSYGLYPFGWPSYTYTFPSWTGFTQYSPSYMGQTSYLNYMVQPSGYTFPSWTGSTPYGPSYLGQINYVNFMSQPPTYRPSQYALPLQSTRYFSAIYGTSGSSALPYSFGTGYQSYGFLPTYGSTTYGYRYR
ncbi:MAG: choice-of-anchor D domain-containing protein, partial [bacterium]